VNETPSYEGGMKFPLYVTVVLHTIEGEFQPEKICAGGEGRAPASKVIVDKDNL
jgi:hypothetical protein